MTNLNEIEKVRNKVIETITHHTKTLEVWKSVFDFLEQEIEIQEGLKDNNA